jgi:hypothetical protein
MHNLIYQIWIIFFLKKTQTVFCKQSLLLLKHLFEYIIKPIHLNFHKDGYNIYEKTHDFIKVLIKKFLFLVY